MGCKVVDCMCEKRIVKKPLCLFVLKSLFDKEKGCVLVFGMV